MRKFFPTGVNPLGVFAVLFLTVSLGVAALVVSNRGLDFNIGEKAAAPLDESLCSGCAGDGFEWSWNKKAEVCKKKASSACGKKAQQEKENPDSCENKGGHCVTGISRCFESGGTDHEGNCNKGVCCAGGAAGKLVQTEDPNSCETSGGQCLASCTNTGLVNTAGNCIKQGTYCCKPRVPDIVPQAGSESSDEEEETSSESNSVALSTEIQVCRLEGGIWQSGKCIYPGQSSSQVVQGGGGQPLLSPANPAPNKKTNNSSCTSNNDCQSGNCTSVPGGRVCQPEGVSFTNIKVPQGQRCGTTAYDRQCEDGSVCVSNKCQVKETVPTVASGSCLETGKVCEGGRGYSDSGGCGGLGIRCGQNPKLAQSTPTIPTSPINTDAPEAENEDPFEKCANSNNAGLCLQRAIKAVQQQLASPTNTTQNPSQNTSETIPSLTPDVPSQEREILIGPRKCSVCQSSGNCRDYTGGDVLIGASYTIFECNGQTGQLENRTDDGYTFADVTVTSGITESDLTAQLVNLNTFNQGRENTPQAGCGGSGGSIIPSGNVALGSGDERQRCNNGRWEPCPGCALTVVPLYLYNDPEFLQEQISRQENYQEVQNQYYTNIQSCLGTEGENELTCHAEALAQFDPNLISQDLIDALDQNFEQGQVLQNAYYPTLEKLNICLSENNNSYAACAGYQHELNRIFASSGLSLANKDFFDSEEGGFGNYITNKVASTYIEARQEYEQCQNEANLANAVNPNCVNPSAILLHPGLPEGESERIIARFDFFQPNLDLCAGKPVCNPFSERYTLLSEAGYSVEEIEAMEKQYRDYLNQIALSGDTGLLQLCGLVATSADQQARCSNDPTYLKNVVLANADPRLQNEFNQELDELTNNLEIQTMLYTGSSQDLIAACKNLYSGIAQAGERRYWCSYPETAKQALLNSLPETFKPQAITAQGSGGRTTVLLAGQAGCNSQGQCVAAVANADGASVSDETQSLTGSYALSCPTSCSLIGANSKPTTSEGFNQGDTVVTRCLDNKTVQTTTTSALAPDGFTYETSCGAGICSQGQCRQATVVVDKATGTPKFCEVGQQSCGTLIDEFGVPYEAIIVQTEDGKLRQQITSNNDAYNAAAEAYFLEHNGEALANFNEGYEVYIDREGAVINIPPEILDHAKYRLFVQENPGSTLADFQNYKLDEYDQYIKDELDVNFFESIGNFFSSQQEKQAAEDLRIFLAEQNQFIRQGIAAGDINLDFLKVGFSQAADQLQQNPLAFTDVIRDSVNLSLTPEQFEAVLANQRKIYNTNNYPDFGQRLLGGGEPTVEDLLAQQSQQFNDALYVYDAFNPHVFTEEELRQLEDPNSALSIQVARNERLSILVDKLGGATSSTLLSALTGEQNYSQLRDQYEGNAILREIIDLNREIDGQFLRSELTKEIGADKIASGDWLGGYWDMAMGNTTQFLTGGLKTGVTGLTGIVAVAGCVGTAGVGCLVAAAGTTLAVNGSLNAASEVSTACVGDTTNCGTSLINLGINIAFTRAASLGLRGARVASTVAQTEITAANLARREILEQTGRELVGKGLADDAFNISQSLVRQSPNLIDQLAINTTRYGAPAWFGYQGVNCLTTEGTNKLDCTLMLAQAAVSTLTWSRAYQQGTGQIVQNRLDFGINSAQALVSCAGSLSTGNYDVCTQSLANAGVSAGQLHQSIGDIYQGQGVGAEDTALVGLLDAQKLVDNLYNPDGTPKKDTNPQQRIEADNALKLAIQSHAQEQIYLLQALKNVEGNENSWTIVQKKLIDVQKAYLDAQANYDILLKGKTPAEVVNTAEFTAYEKARQLLKNTYQTLVLEQYALAAPKGKSPDEAVQTEYETAFREFEEISKKLSPAETAYQEAYQRLLNAREALDSSLLQPTQREIQEAVSARTAEAAELEAQISLAERELTALKDSQSAEAYRQELIDKIAGAQAKGAQEEANSLSPMLARAEEIVRLVQNGGDPLTQAVSEHLILIKTLSENVVALGAEMTTLTQAKEQAGKPLARIMERLGRTPTADQVAGEVQRPARPSEQTPPRRSVREILLGSDNSPTLLGNLARRLGGNPQQEVGLGALAQKFPNLQEALSQTPDVKTFIQGEGNIFRLKAPDGASPEVVSEISRFNNILEKFESDFGNPAYDTQVEKLALAVKDNKILIQLEAGGGKTQVLAPITAALEGNSIVHLATKTDALDVVKQFSARQAFFESAFSDFKVYYFDSTRGFLAIDPAKTFDIENARTVSAQTVRRAMEAAKQNPLQAGVAIITQTSELAWGTVRGRTSGAGDVDKVLFEMVNKNFSLVGDEAGVTAGSRFSVSFGNEEVLSRLTNPKLLAGVENGQRLLELSAGVEKLSSLAEFRQQILNTLSRKGDHRANFVQIERNGNVYSTWIPADQQVIRDSYAEIIQNTLRTLPNEASLLKGELDNLLTLARNGDIESLNKGFSDLLQRTNLTTSTDRLVLAELAYQRADLHARWEVLYKIPGNDFGQESGLIVLRKVGETTGEQFQEVARKIALQEEGANMLRAAGIGVEDTAPLVSVGNLTLAPDSSSITMSELYQYSDRTILFDATPLTAEAQLGIASAGLPESAPKPKEFFIDPNIQTLADKGLALIPENKGLAVVMNAEGSSFDQGTNIIIQKRRPEYVAVTRYTRRANGEILPQYYLEKIAYNPDGSIIRNPIGRIDDLDGWNAAIQELLPTLQGPQELLIVFEGRNRAVDLKVKNGLHQNFEWAQIADPQNNGEGLLQGVRRNRVLAETGDAATWSPELIAEHSGYHLWVLGDPNVLKLGGSNLNADNVVAYFDQRTQLDIVKLKTENLIANLSKNSESLLESVRSSLLENRPSGISEEQIRSVMDDIASDARRVSLARTSDLSTTPLTGETIANDVYLQGLSAHEQRLNYLNEIQGRLNLPESTFAQIRSQLGVENSYPDKVVFDSALRGSPVAPEQIAESSAPGRIALEWAQENSIQTLDSLALFRQSLDEKTVVARAKSAETVTEKLAQAARQILAPTDVAVPLRNLGSSLTRLPASILAGLRNTLPNLGNTSQNVSQDISIEQAGLETAPANQGESPTSSLTVQRPQTQDLPAPLPAQPAENVQVSNPYIEIISGKPVLINLPSSGLTIEQAEKIEQELAKVGETIDSVAIAKTIETVKEEGGNDVQFVETSQAEVYVTANGLRSGAIGGTPDTFLIGFGQNTGGAVLSAQTGTTESISVNGRTIDIAKEQILLKSGDEVEFGTFRMRYEGLDSSQRGRFVLIDKVTNLAGLELEEVVATQDGAIIPRDPKFWSKQGLVNSFKNATPEKIFGRVRDVFFKDGKINPLRTAWQLARRINPVVVLGDVASVATNRWTITRVYIDQILINYLFDNLGLPHLPWFARPFIAYDTYRFFWQEGWRGVVPKDFQPQALAFAKEGLTLTKQALVRLDRLIAERAFLPKPTLTAEEKDIFLLRGVIDTNGTRSAVAVLASYLPRVEIKNLNGTTTIIHTKARQAYEAAEAGYRSGSIKPGEVVTNIPAPEIQPIPLSQSAWQGEKFGTVHGDNSEAAMDLVQSGLIAKGYPNELPVKIKIYVDDETFQDEVTTNVGVLAQSLKRIFAAEATRDKVVTIFLGSSEVFYGQIEHYAGSEPSREFAFLVQDDNVSKFSEDVVNNLRNEPNITRGTKADARKDLDILQKQWTSLERFLFSVLGRIPQKAPSPTAPQAPPGIDSNTYAITLRLMKNYGLTPDTIFYRVMDPQYLDPVNMRVPHNPASIALVRDNYHAVEHPITKYARENGIVLKEQLDPLGPKVSAQKVGPGLNVAVMDPSNYRKDGQVTISIRLADLLAVGGRIYRDEGAMASGIQPFYIVFDKDLPFQFVNLGIGEENKSEPEDYDAQILSLINSGAPGSLSGKTKNGTGFVFSSTGARHELTLIPILPVENKPEALFSPSIAESIEEISGRLNNIKIKVQGISYQAVSNQYAAEAKFRFDSHTAEAALEDNKRYKVYLFTNNSVLIYPGQHRIDLEETNVGVSESPLEKIHIGSEYDFEIWAPALATRMLLAGFPENMQVTFEGYTSNKETRSIYPGTLGTLARGDLSTMVTETLDERFVLPVTIDGKSHKFAVGDLIQLASGVDIIIVNIAKLNGTVDIRVLSPESEVSERRRFTLAGLEDYLNREGKPEVVRRYPAEKAIYYPSEYETSLVVTPEFESILKEERDFIGIYAKRPLEFSTIGDREFIWSDKETSHEELIKAHGLFSKEVPVKLNFSSNNKKLLVSGEALEIVRVLSFLAKHKNFEEISASFFNESGIYTTIDGSLEEVRSGVERTITERSLVTTNPNRALAMPINYYQAIAADWVRESALKGLLERLNIPNLFQIPQLPSGTTPESNTRSTSTNLSQPVSLESASLSSLVTLTETIISRFPLPLKNLGGFYDEDSLKRSVIRTASELEENGLVVVDETGSTPKTPSLFLAELKKMLNDEPLSSRIKSAERLEGIALSLYQLSAELEKNIASSEAQEAEQVAEEARITHEAYLRLQRRIFTVLALSQNLERASQNLESGYQKTLWSLVGNSDTEYAKAFIEGAPRETLRQIIIDELRENGITSEGIASLRVGIEELASVLEEDLGNLLLYDKIQADADKAFREDVLRSATEAQIPDAVTALSPDEAIAIARVSEAIYGTTRPEILQLRQAIEEDSALRDIIQEEIEKAYSQALARYQKLLSDLAEIDKKVDQRHNLESLGIPETFFTRPQLPAGEIVTYQEPITSRFSLGKALKNVGKIVAGVIAVVTFAAVGAVTLFWYNNFYAVELPPPPNLESSAQVESLPQNTESELSYEVRRITEEFYESPNYLSFALRDWFEQVVKPNRLIHISNPENQIRIYNRYLSQAEIENVVNSPILHFAFLGTDLTPNNAAVQDLWDTTRNDLTLDFYLNMETGEITTVTINRDFRLADGTSLNTIMRSGVEGWALPGVEQDDYLTSPLLNAQMRIEALTGVPVDMINAINFSGFTSLVNTLYPSGLTINVPFEWWEYDQNGAAVKNPAGTYTFNGSRLLQFIRFRKQNTQGTAGRDERMQFVMAALRDSQISQFVGQGGDVDAQFNQLQKIVENLISDNGLLSSVDLFSGDINGPANGLLASIEYRDAVARKNIDPVTYSAHILGLIDGLSYEQVSIEPESASQLGYTDNSYYVLKSDGKGMHPPNIDPLNPQYSQNEWDEDLIPGDMSAAHQRYDFIRKIIQSHVSQLFLLPQETVLEQNTDTLTEQNTAPANAKAIVALNTLSPYAGFATVRSVSEDGRNNWNQEEWLPMSLASLPDYSNLSAPEKVLAVIDYLNIKNPNNLRYTMDGNDTTFCNIFVSDFTSIFGVPIPRWINGEKVNANFIYKWLADLNQGGALGWKAVTASEAQRLANLGRTVVGAIERIGRPGHVFVVIPGTGASVDGGFYPTIANVGLNNFVGGDASQVLIGNDEPVYYVNETAGYEFTTGETAFQPAFALFNPALGPVIVAPLTATKFVRYITAPTQNWNGFFGRLHKAAVNVDDWLWGKVIPKSPEKGKPNINLPPIPKEVILESERTIFDDLKQVIIDERGQEDGARIIALAEKIYSEINSPDAALSRLASVVDLLQKRGLITFERDNRAQNLGAILSWVDRMDRNFKKLTPRLQSSITAHERLEDKYAEGIVRSDDFDLDIENLGVIILSNAEMDLINPDKRHATRAFYNSKTDTFFVRHSVISENPEFLQKTLDHETSHLLNDFWNRIQLKPEVDRYFAGRQGNWYRLIYEGRTELLAYYAQLTRAETLGQKPALSFADFSKNSHRAFRRAMQVFEVDIREDLLKKGYSNEQATELVLALGRGAYEPLITALGGWDSFFAFFEDLETEARELVIPTRNQPTEISPEDILLSSEEAPHPAPQLIELNSGLNLRSAWASIKSIWQKIPKPQSNQVPQNQEQVIRAVYPITRAVGFNKIEERVINLANTLIEQEQELAQPFSFLSQLEVNQAKQNNFIPQEDGSVSEAELYAQVSTELSERKADGEISVIQTEADTINPYGKIDEANFYVVSDPHYTPSDTVGGIRENYFKRYGLLNVGGRETQNLKEIIDQFKGAIPEGVLNHLGIQKRDPLLRFHPAKVFIEKASDWNTIFKWIVTHDVRFLFEQWLTPWVDSQRKYTQEELVRQNQEGKRHVDIMAFLGDDIHNGAELTDQLGVFLQEIGLVDEIKRRGTQRLGPLSPDVLTFNLYGNHDQDYRVYEAFAMMNELFGFRIFTQEIGDVMVAALDTNIMSPENQRIFRDMRGEKGVSRLAEILRENIERLAVLKKEGAASEEIAYLEKLISYQEERLVNITQDPQKEIRLMEEKLVLQEKIIERIQAHPGPVVILAHNPPRVIDSLGNERKVLQNSNVIHIVGGHTHRGEQFVLDIKNKEGNTIRLDFIDSVLHLNPDSPTSPRTLAFKVDGKGVSDSQMHQEDQEVFSRRYREFVESNMRSEYFETSLNDKLIELNSGLTPKAVLESAKALGAKIWSVINDQNLYAFSPLYRRLANTNTGPEVRVRTPKKLEEEFGSYDGRRQRSVFNKINGFDDDPLRFPTRFWFNLGETATKAPIFRAIREEMEWAELVQDVTQWIYRGKFGEKVTMYRSQHRSDPAPKSWTSLSTSGNFFNQGEIILEYKVPAENIFMGAHSYEPLHDVMGEDEVILNQRGLAGASLVAIWEYKPETLGEIWGYTGWRARTPSTQELNRFNRGQTKTVELGKEYLASKMFHQRSPAPFMMHRQPLIFELMENGWNSFKLIGQKIGKFIQDHTDQNLYFIPPVFRSLIQEPDTLTTTDRDVSPEMESLDREGDLNLTSKPSPSDILDFRAQENEIPFHTECVDGICVTVPGFGANKCISNLSCQSTPKATLSSTDYLLRGLTAGAVLELVCIFNESCTDWITDRLIDLTFWWEDLTTDGESTGESPTELIKVPTPEEYIGKNNQIETWISADNNSINPIIKRVAEIEDLYGIKITLNKAIIDSGSLTLSLLEEVNSALGLLPEHMSGRIFSENGFPYRIYILDVQGSGGYAVTGLLRGVVALFMDAGFSRYYQNDDITTSSNQSALIHEMLHSYSIGDQVRSSELCSPFGLETCDMVDAFITASSLDGVHFALDGRDSSRVDANSVAARDFLLYSQYETNKIEGFSISGTAYVLAPEQLLLEQPTVYAFFRDYVFNGVEYHEVIDENGSHYIEQTP